MSVVVRSLKLFNINSNNILKFYQKPVQIVLICGFIGVDKNFRRFCVKKRNNTVI